MALQKPLSGNSLPAILLGVHGKVGAFPRFRSKNVAAYDLTYPGDTGLERSMQGSQMSAHPLAGIHALAHPRFPCQNRRNGSHI